MMDFSFLLQKKEIKPEGIVGIRYASHFDCTVETPIETPILVGWRIISNDAWEPAP